MIYTVTLNPAIDRELLVPLIEYDTVLRASDWQVDFGGKGFNVSRLLVGFDTTSVALGFVGGDSGKLMQRGLQALGIPTDFVWVDGETRTNVSIRSETQDTYIKVNEPGPTITQKDLDNLLDKVKSLARPGQWWALCGSLPPGCPPEIYAEITRYVQKGGGKVALDASGQPLLFGCQASPDVCKPNLVEAQHLTDIGDADALQIAEAVAGLGPRNVVMSLGRDGAAYYGEEGKFKTSTPEIREKNPIGAGDSMVGGMLWALTQDYGYEDAVRWGVACGAATASLEGTSVAAKADAEKLIGQIVIKK